MMTMSMGSAGVGLYGMTISMTQFQWAPPINVYTAIQHNPAPPIALEGTPVYGTNFNNYLFVKVGDGVTAGERIK